MRQLCLGGSLKQHSLGAWNSKQEGSSGDKKKGGGGGAITPDLKRKKVFSIEHSSYRCKLWTLPSVEDINHRKSNWRASLALIFKWVFFYSVAMDLLGSFSFMLTHPSHRSGHWPHCVQPHSTIYGPVEASQPLKLEVGGLKGLC
jgi:hypothetical protein